jgi:hypothetical protein
VRQFDCGWPGIVPTGCFLGHCACGPGLGGRRLQVGSAWRLSESLARCADAARPSPTARDLLTSDSESRHGDRKLSQCVRTDSPLRPGCGLREPRRGLATLQPHGSHSGEKLAVGELEPSRLLTLESARRLGLRTTSLNRTGNRCAHRTDGRVFIVCPGLARVTPVD